MQYKNHYQSPLGNMLLAADDIGLTGLWFEGQKYFSMHLNRETEEIEEKELPIFEDTKRWLDIYFDGKEPDFGLPLHLVGTEFQKEVWVLLEQIPYGQTTTYGEMAGRIAAKKGLRSMSAQAVGSAVGHNPISIIVPCHRVLGKDRSLTGYAGGLGRKAELLKLEKIIWKQCFNC